MKPRFRHVRYRHTLSAGLAGLLGLGVCVPAGATATQDAFDRLSSSQAEMVDPVGVEGRSHYRAPGTPIEFFLDRDGRAATILFPCPGPTDCDLPHDLRSGREAGGNLVFRTSDRRKVMEVSPAGSGTLYGGPGFVPRDVPKTGIAVVRD